MSDPVSILPAHWRKVRGFGPDGVMYMSLGRLKVIVTDAPASDSADNHAWRHISLSREDRLPSYDDIVEVKEIFAGVEEKAVMVFPPRSRHVNICPNCLHLFRCLDADPLPEFSGEVNGRRTL